MFGCTGSAGFGIGASPVYPLNVVIFAICYFPELNTNRPRGHPEDTKRRCVYLYQCRRLRVLRVFVLEIVPSLSSRWLGHGTAGLGGEGRQVGLVLHHLAQVAQAGGWAGLPHD